MQNKKLNIVIADDHPLFRAGVKQTISSIRGVNIVGEAEDGVIALKLINETLPDIAILDLKMPKKSGLEILTELADSGCRTKIVLLTMYKNLHYFYQAISLGAKGYIVKETATNDLVSGIEKIRKNGIYVSNKIYQLLDKEKKQRSEYEAIIESINVLSQTEREILKLVGTLKTNSEIAEIMSLSKRTIENRRLRICENLNLKGVHGLLQFTIENHELF
jgi:DNA-binding NarL/FixJ family response regulator